MSVKVCFPLDKTVASEDVFRECINWILDSPFTEFAEEDLSTLPNMEDFSFEKGHERIEYSLSQTPDLFVSSLRYIKSTNIARWTTEISTRVESDGHWVNVVASIDTATALNEAPKINKPLIIIRLISRFGGADDGGVPISINPILLEENSYGLGIAKAVINSTTTCAIPLSARANLSGMTECLLLLLELI